MKCSENVSKKGPFIEQILKKWEGGNAPLPPSTRECLVMGSGIFRRLRFGFHQKSRDSSLIGLEVKNFSKSPNISKTCKKKHAKSCVKK